MSTKHLTEREYRNYLYAKNKMPAKSKPLGFTCRCGRDYGSKQKLTIYNNRRRNEEYSKKRVLSKRNEVDRIKPSPNLAFKPVEYALNNKIRAHADERYLKVARQGLEEIRRSHLWQSMSVFDRQILIDNVFAANARVNARNKQIEELNRRYSKWEVIHNPDEIDPRIYRFMKELGSFLTEDKLNDVCDDNKYTLGKTKTSVRWNPIMEIKEYERLGDPLPYIYVPWGFYEKVLCKHAYVITEYITETERDIIAKGVEIFNRYRDQFSNKKFLYTWFEWLWISAYATTEGVGKTRNMLHELNVGDGQKRRILSRKHIRNMIGRVIKFWEDYFEYIPYFFGLLNLIQVLIQRDEELKEKYEKMLEQLEKENDVELTHREKRYLDKTTPQIFASTDNSTTNNNYVIDGSSEDDKSLTASRKASELIRVHHSNPNYAKEMKEFEEGLRKEKPKRIKSCGPFKPTRLLPLT
ncbi:MAG: hypothetical protein M3044_00755 [Thermoproteota archaeon]|nr:hypothetical protein [Thermoproteota archaeon]